MQNKAFITGASKGIGKATAALFLAQGWHVINLSRSHCDLPQVDNYSIDLADKSWGDEVAQYLQQSANNAAKICLVHNAAWCQPVGIEAIDIDKYRMAVEINMIAPIKLNQLLIADMPAGSSIIYIGSTLSEKSVRNMAVYSITKHASIGMMRSTCQDLMNSGIHTCCVCPGFTDTEMLRDNANHDPAIINAIKSRINENRLIDPKEIAELIYYSANHSVINGAILHANLGQVES